MEGESKTNAEAPKAESPAHAKPKGAAWALPLVKLDRGWSWIEARLLFGLLLLLVIALVIWISLRGLSSPIKSDNSAGMVFRALVGAGIFGAITRVVTG